MSRINRADDINAQAEATATAIQTALTPLLTEQQTSGVAEQQTLAAEAQTEAAVAIKGVSEDIQASDIPGAVDLVKQSAAASLDVATAVSELPASLASSFERIIDAFIEAGEGLIEFADRLQSDGVSAVIDQIFGTGAERSVTNAFGILSEGIAR